LSSILYYITGHGYGHAVRSSQVIRRLKKVRPDCEVHVRTTAPEWLFPRSIRYSRQSIDVGITQRDSLEMDLDATLRACRLLQVDAPRIIARELAFIREHDVKLVVGDIPPLGFEIAARGSLPSVAISNFSWNFIYRSYVDQLPDFRPLIDEMEEYYSKATLALTLPYPCDMEVFPRREPIPWIARVSRLQKNEARKLFSLPQSANIVLLSFGGLGLRRLPWDRIKELREYLFVTTADEANNDGNILTLPDMQRHYEDLVRAADVVVSKVGYGVVADVIVHQTPVLYTDRGDFAEYPRLAQALNDCATADFISQDQLFAGEIRPYLEGLLNREQRWPPVEITGADVAAEKILALYSEQD